MAWIVVGKDEFPRRAILIDPDPNWMVDTGPYVQLLRPPWVYVLFPFIIWMHYCRMHMSRRHQLQLHHQLHRLDARAVMDILKFLASLFPLFLRLCPCCGGGGGRGGDSGKVKDNPMTAAAASIQRGAGHQAAAWAGQSSC